MALLLLVAIHYRLGHELPDDAAFFLRYAENMARGQFWVWNLGEAPVWGASAPLFPLLFVLPLKLGMAPIPAVLWTSILVGVVALTWAALLMRRYFGDAAAWVLVVFLCLDSGVMHFAGSGLETPLTFVLLVAALHVLLARQQGKLCMPLSESGCLGLGWDARRKAQRYPAVSRAFATPQTAQSQDAPATTGLCRASRDVWLGVVAGLLAVQKLDLAPAAVLLLVVAAVQARRIPWRALAAAACIAAAWYGFAWYWFGSPVPNSFLTKAFHQNQMIRQFGWNWFASAVFWKHGHWIFTILALLGVRFCWREYKPLLVFCLGCLGIHVLAYSIKYPFEAYDWYWMPAMFLLLWLAAVGACRVGAAIGARVPRVRWLPALTVALLCGVIVAGLVPLERRETHERKHWLDYGEYDRA